MANRIKVSWSDGRDELFDSQKEAIDSIISVIPEAWPEEVQEVDPHGNIMKYFNCAWALQLEEN